MQKSTSRITQSPFVRSVATLSGGQSMAAIIPIIAAPILGRLYSPAEYGVLVAFFKVDMTVFSLF